YDHLLIRYGELGLKGKNMNQFINKLQSNLQRALANFPDVRITRSPGRLFVVLHGQDPEPVIKACQKVFGIYSMSLAMKVENDEAAIKSAALASLQNVRSAKTFKVKVRRANKDYPTTSMDMSRLLGGQDRKSTRLN